MVNFKRQLESILKNEMKILGILKNSKFWFRKIKYMEILSFIF